MQVRAVIVVASLGSVAVACGSSSPAEVVIKPGITAIEQSSALACDADLVSLRTAIESFTLLNVDPPTAESDLVPDWLRSESKLYDLVDGAIVPADGSGCAAMPAAATGAPPDTTASGEAARLQQPGLSTTLPSSPVTLPVDFAECEQQRQVLEIAMEVYLAQTGAPALTEADLVPMYIRSEISGYDIVDGVIVPAPSSTCPAT